MSYERDGAFNHRGERHYNDVLLGDENGQVRQMTTVASEYSQAPSLQRKGDDA